MVRKIVFLALLGIMSVLFAGCASEAENTRLFTSNNSTTITLEEPMTFYKTMDIDGPILGKVNAGQYEVLSAETAEDEQGIWVQIEFNGEKGFVFGVIFQE